MPLVFSGVLYASNGRFKIAYIDSLFICISSMTMGGLATIDLSSLTPWQQVILFIEMCLGNPVFISWIIVFVRTHYFAKKFKHIASISPRRHSAVTSESPPTVKGWLERLGFFFYSTESELITTVIEEHKSQDRSDGHMKRLRPDMIRRVDGTPKPVNPSGSVSEGPPPSLIKHVIVRPDLRQPGLPLIKSSTVNSSGGGDATNSSRRRKDLRLVRRKSDPGMGVALSTTIGMPWLETTGAGIGPRTQTIEFLQVNVPRRRGRSSDRQRSALRASNERQFTNSNLASQRQAPAQSLARRGELKNRDLGGFPMPWEIIKRLIRCLFPNLNRKLTRTLTMPRTMSLVSGRADAPPGAKVVPYISFDAAVDRNSSFHHLTSEQRDEIGGVEYRALGALLWIVGIYHVVVQVTCFVVIAPYMSQPRWASNFVPPQQDRVVNTVWFSLFQVVSAYSNTGTSLADQSMIPFQTAYPMIVLLIFLLLAGNAAYPIFLRFVIWIITKCVPKQSRMNETLHFLLDHPRRCYTLLFPSHQTWFLVTIVLILTISDWVSFLVLDIGNAAFSQLSVGLQVINGLLQASTVRTAGFSAISIAALAPAVKVMYVVMMYISVYPIALSVRATNVYEERSLGIFNDEEHKEEDFEAVGSRVSIWGKYLALHARKQLAFDMWWLSLALFLICIIERDKLVNLENAGWFNIFNILFEIVSAYGTVGLSTGVPSANYSLSGAFRPSSKLIICVVMLRGRHRGLPVAIDRAVLLPSEYEEYDDSDNEGSDNDIDNNGKPSTKIDDVQPINQRIDPYISVIEKSSEGIMEERRKP
ncbi:cation transport protein-domain-containing protein [Amanita rubescens]|nr:cation transport protein-domain-containing protein [Amanita rubescens]